LGEEILKYFFFSYSFYLKKQKIVKENYFSSPHPTLSSRRGLDN